VSSRWSHHTFCDYLARLSLPFSLFLMNHTLVYLPLLFKTFNDSHQSHKIEDNSPNAIVTTETQTKY